MATFGRSFETEHLERALTDSPWVRDLLCRWHPAGESGRNVTSERSLRLCIRDGYLNFYRAGQSVAAMRFLRNGKPQAEIHNKYVYGAAGQGQKYVRLTNEGYQDREGGQFIPYESGGVDVWIENVNPGTSSLPNTSKGHIGREKKFVDQIVGRNPNVIDLEMAVPAFKDRAEQRRAPRMDLVALETDGDFWKIVFWEIKRADDGRARSRSPSPEVISKQLAPFAEWVEDHQKLIIEAYQTVCRRLVEFHVCAKVLRPDIADLGEGIRQVAKAGAPRPTVDLQPRLLIDDFNSHDIAFTANQHLAKLRELYAVQVVGSESEMLLKHRPCL